ncbi:MULTISPECIES: restriction endonuclease [Klebsiella]|uniref:restriction endonuclease n=1 Tax=Klebsiella TaxID=570 RepID=UPI0006674FA8|nr:restriction endonuclease [Klebsiella quasipneumoniae]MCJ7350849.1 restriction endonuclease [Klebsiella quasipneumoniae]MCV6933165.1 restriction endonuclease [Klebsiella quasipneumoniae]MCW9379875.1 restriction endonuclease [Klebsiella quasipneumoniae]MCW9418585.1 restriction endonuclease [Klebsiella quasipneumoniae]MEB6002181.1 restriction endonuclease [Klebsiella quasipneumoniae]
MIYQCYSCNKTSFEIICPWCSGTIPITSSPWGSRSSSAKSSDLQEMIPLDPSFYPEFQYQSKGMLKDLFGKKKEQSQLNQLLENVLEKYSKFKDPYFTNFIYTSRFSNNQTTEVEYSEYNGVYSDVRLFREVLVRKGFSELEQLPILLDKLLLTTSFNALYYGFAKEVKRHIKPTVSESFKSWIEEAGTTFRADLSLFLFHLWDNKVTFSEIEFNDNAKNTPGLPLVSFENIKKYLSICEGIYFDILVERLATRLEHFNPSKFVTMYLIDAMDGYQFENFLVEIFQTLGYDVKETKKTQDQGADLFVTRFGKNMVIQAKNYSGSVGNSAVQQAISAKAFYGCDEAMVVTNSYYTKSAMELADSARVRLIDRNELQKYLDDYNQKIIEDFQSNP